MLLAGAFVWALQPYLQTVPEDFGIAPGVVWQCHCCAKDNTPDAVKCCVCGRGPGYRRFAAPRPLLLPGCVAAHPRGACPKASKFQ